jgi:hypothetical protein
MTRRRLLLLFGVVAAALLVAVGAANAVYRADASGERKSHSAVAAQRAGARDVGIHAGVLKTERSQRLLRFGLAVLGAGLAAVALRGRRTGATRSGGTRLGFAVGALGRGPPALRVR